MARHASLCGAGTRSGVPCPPQACQDPQNRPSFLSEKPLETAIKHLVKKFPVAETKVSDESAAILLLALEWSVS